MKKLSAVSALLITLLALFLVFSVNAFAEGEEITVKAENTATGVSVTWTELEDVYFYELYRQSNDGSEEVLLSKAQGTQFTDTEAEPGVIYGYKVIPVTTDESRGTESNLAIIYRMSAPEITNAYSTDTGLYLEWSGLKEAKGYYIMRRNQQEEKWTAIAKCSEETTSYTDKSSDPDAKYLYSIIGFAGQYLSPASNQVTLSYFACPKIVAATSTEKGIAIKWTPVSSAAYYIIYRSVSSEEDWKPYSIVASEYSIYHDKDVKSGVSYSYIVRASDSSGQLSPYDEAVSMKLIGKPVINKAYSDTNGVRLAWNRVEGCHGYAVYRKDYGSNDWSLAGLAKGEDTIEFVDRKVLNSKVYTYTVRAVWNKNLSAYDEKGITIRFLEAPQALLCDPDTASGNVLTWRNNGSASVFIVYRKAANDKWRPIGLTAENRFADKKADPEGTYYYTVQAFTSSTYLSGYATIVGTAKVVTYDSDAKLVALTYDDGPSNTVTNNILDILEMYGAKATFFVIGENIEYNNEALTRAAAMGCEIGTHTFSHIDLPTSSEAEIREEIQLTDALVQKYTGKPTQIARAPGGEIDSTSGQIVNKPFYYWSIDTRDWESKDPDSIISIVQSQVEDGDIILMHDVYDETYTASTTIIPWLISEGYQLVTVSELMAHNGVTPQAGVTYYNGFGGTAYTD